MFAIALCYFIVGIVEIFLFINFDTLLSVDFVSIALATNTFESQEFLSFYLLNAQTLLSLGAFVVFSLIMLLWRQGPDYHATHLMLFACLILCSILAIKLYYVSKEGGRDGRIAWFNDKNAIVRFYNTLKNGIKVQKDFIDHYAKLKGDLDTNLNMLNSKEHITSSLNLPQVVLIIGESTQRNYMQLYGYPLPTTPHLSALEANGNLVVFSDVISPHSHTNQVLQKMLTFSNYENAKTPWYKQQNLLDILNLADYKTYWISNQEAISIYGNAPETISQRAHITRFSRMKDSYGAGVTPDEVLIPIAQDFIRKSTKSATKNFYAFHLMGTHGGYKGRYPQSFEIFTPHTLQEANLDYFLPYNPHQSQKLTQSQLKVKSEYLNAILYNDYVVSEIIKLFANSDTLILYLSDHCDEVYDFRDFVGHTETKGSRFMVEVPFMVYMSDEFKAKHKDIVARISQAKHKPFMSDDFIHALLDIMGITSNDFDSTRSLFAPDYNASRPRIYSGRDYDKELKNLFGQYQSTTPQSTKIPQKLWLHRVDEIAKLKDFLHTYDHFEIDVHFLKEHNGKTNYFDVGHDGAKYSIGLDLDEMFQLLSQKNLTDSESMILTGGGANTTSSKPRKWTSKVWVDFKNLSQENKNAALAEMLRLCQKYNIPHQNLIIESQNHKALDVFAKKNFFTSYYVPYYSAEQIKTQKDAIYTQIQDIINSGNVQAISFAYYLYDFIKGGAFKITQNGVSKDIALLTWNEGKNWRENMNEAAFYDTQVEIILVGEKGAYR